MTPNGKLRTNGGTYRHALREAVDRYEDLVKCLSLLREIDSIDDVTEPLGLVCRRLVELILRQSRAENCSLMLLDTHRNRLELWATMGCLQDEATSSGGDAPLQHAFDIGHGIVGQVALQGAPLRVSDARELTAQEQLPDTTAGTRSLLCVPICIRGRTLGVINLSHAAKDFFTEDDQATMMMVADRAALLLTSHQLLRHHRAVERCYQLALEQAGDAIVVLDEDGSVGVANSVAEQLLNVKSGGRADPALAWLECVHEQDRPALQRARDGLWRSGAACTTQFRVVGPQGQVRHVEEHATLFVDTANRRASVCVLRDVTRRILADQERVALEAQLRHAQKMEALGELAGGITHDFNNILAGILANVSLARMAADATLLPELLADIETAAEQGSAMTRRLLAVSRRSQVERATVDVVDLIDDVVAILRNTLDRRVGLHRSCQPGLWKVRADRSQAHQALLNLCVNARDALAHLPQGHHAVISVSATNEHVDQAHCEVELQATAGDFVCIAVTDTGRGIRDDIRSRIFEPFFTTRESDGGTGLGLAIAYGVARQHGGWLAVESQQGRGSTFRFFLPRSNRVESIRAVPLPQNHRNIGNATVLVVDDEDIMRRAARRVLRKLGVDVIMARDGLEAVELFRSSKKRIDVVLLDLNMPRMSGDEALTLLRDIDPLIPIIISSGHTRAVDEDRLNPDAPLLYLEKPYTFQMLAQTLRKILVRNGD
jgi:PAS domain S-box-containing protein